uniref:Uncharacterized protein n=1 Tax=Cacopsylla melanoneura TaxID=428564 RepID=A0A8D8UJN2_9HEMI
MQTTIRLGLILVETNYTPRIDPTFQTQVLLSELTLIHSHSGLRFELPPRKCPHHIPSTPPLYTTPASSSLKSSTLRPPPISKNRFSFYANLSSRSKRSIAE